MSENLAASAPVAQQGNINADVLPPDASYLAEGFPDERSDEQPEAQLETHQQEEDPEFDFGEVGKFKKKELSELLKKRKELDKGAYEKFQQAAKLRKETEEAREQLKQVLTKFNDPAAFLKELGVDPVEFSIKQLESFQQEANKTPEQRQLEELKRQNEELTRKEQARLKELQAQQQQQQMQAAEQVFEKAFVETLDGIGVPKDPIMIQMIATRSANYLSQLGELEPEMVYPALRNVLQQVSKEYVSELQTSIRSFLESMPEDKAAEWLGKNIPQKLSRRLAEEKTKEVVNKIKQVKPSRSDDYSEKQYIGWADVQEMKRKGII